MPTVLGRSSKHFWQDLLDSRIVALLLRNFRIHVARFICYQLFVNGFDLLEKQPET